MKILWEFWEHTKEDHIKYEAYNTKGKDARSYGKNGMS